jgi:hypothetical protein
MARSPSQNGSWDFRRRTENGWGGRIRLDLKLDGPGRPERRDRRHVRKKSFKISSQIDQCGVMSFARAVTVFDMMFCAYRSPVCVKMTCRSVKYAVA